MIMQKRWLHLLKLGNEVFKFNYSKAVFSDFATFYNFFLRSHFCSDLWVRQILRVDIWMQNIVTHLQLLTSSAGSAGPKHSTDYSWCTFVTCAP